MTRVVAGVALGALMLITGVVFTAGKSDSDVLREMRDRAEIEDLLWRYTRALDTGNGEAYASVYTPDGQFGTGSNATKGREALQKMVGDGRARQAAAEAKGEPRRPQMYHATANHMITFTDKDHARVDAYYITGVAGNGESSPPRVAGVGRSIDELVRLNGKWLIKSRNVQPQD